MIVTCVQQVSERLLLVPQTELLRALQIEPAVLLLGWAGNVAFADAVPEKKNLVSSLRRFQPRNTV